MASRTDDLGDLIHRAERLFRGALTAALEETGLTASQAQVIRAFARSEHTGLTHKQIAEAIAADIATTSGLLDRLTKAGWLIASPHPEDARSRLYFLTDKSRDVLADLEISRSRATAQAAQRLSPRESALLVRLLARLLK